MERLSVWHDISKTQLVHWAENLCADHLLVHVHDTVSATGESRHVASYVLHAIVVEVCPPEQRPALHFLGEFEVME